jgi:S-adenosylmethionine:tRNA ribosyltransferase-isomerase
MKTLKLSDFDYEIPQELIAQYPAPLRDSSRLLVLDRNSGKILHKDFKTLTDYIRREDIIVVNNTRVINARLIGRRKTGGKVEIFLLEGIGENRFKALLRPSKKIREGEEVIFDRTSLRVRVVVKKEGGNIIEFSSPSNNIGKELKSIGRTPLPPYIKRDTESLDSERYQTVYAREEGATAAPTAGLHFTKKVLEDILSKGAKLAYVTLHVSYGTFASVKTEDVTKHQMHEESFKLAEDTAREINNVKENGGRVFAVGTTSLRVLETCAVQVVDRPPMSKLRRTGKLEAAEGKTNLFVYPPYKFKIVDALLTNFHIPKSTLLMLVCAFAGSELIFKAYREAIAKKYKFFSYGDCMLIL